MRSRRRFYPNLVPRFSVARVVPRPGWLHGGAPDSVPGSVKGMPDQPIQFSSGIPSTVLPATDSRLQAQLQTARKSDSARQAVGQVVAGAPKFLDGWATLGDLGRDAIERYAAYRVGYHRGLDALRANGWRGSGYVRWAEQSNRGFLRCLVGLQQAAEAIGELDESERITQFLAQLDPTGAPQAQAQVPPIQ